MVQNHNNFNKKNSIILFPGQVASGLPDIKIPPMHTTIGNQTLNTIDMVTYVGSSIIALPLISILESIAVAKAFCEYKAIENSVKIRFFPKKKKTVEFIQKFLFKSIIISQR